MGEIIIRDLTTGESFAFVPVKEGYYAASAKIDEIIQKGHKVGGDIARVRYVTG